MFVRIQPQDMVRGNKYKIDNYTGYFIEEMMWGYVFRGVHEDNGDDPIANILEFPETANFYEFVFQNPQQKMEQRSLNLILQPLFGELPNGSFKN